MVLAAVLLTSIYRVVFVVGTNGLINFGWSHLLLSSDPKQGLFIHTPQLE
jgi:hypothetical protein